jgi:alpha-galactosidase
MIDATRMANAMTFLAETDEPYAEAKTSVERLEIVRKRARARIFLTSEGTVETRKAQAETHADVCTEDDRYIDAMRIYETLRAKRERAEILIDVWRSLESSRRKS